MRHAKNTLGQHLYRLRRLDRRLTVLIIEVDQRLSRGIGWFGSSEGNWDNPLVGHMRYFDGIATELEHSTADLRAMNAFGATERLRADLERLTDSLRKVAEIPTTLTRGSRISILAASPSNTGFKMTLSPPLRCDQNTSTRSTNFVARPNFFRTSIYRLYGNDYISGYEAEWPVEVRPDKHIDTAPLWGGEPRPIS